MSNPEYWCGRLNEGPNQQHEARYDAGIGRFWDDVAKEMSREWSLVWRMRRQLGIERREALIKERQGPRRAGVSSASPEAPSGGLRRTGGPRARRDPRMSTGSKYLDEWMDEMSGAGIRFGPSRLEIEWRS
jgi:hypothetical protein